MPSFDAEIRTHATRLLLQARDIEVLSGVYASEVTPGIPDVRPVRIKMTDARTGLPIEALLEVDACLVATGRRPHTAGLGLAHRGIVTDRGFICTDAHLRVLRGPASGAGGQVVVDGVYCVGDANGKMMLAHAAAAQVRSSWVKLSWFCGLCWLCVGSYI